MNDRPHIGFVDAHTEGVGSHHHARLIVFPRLHFLILIGVHKARMEEIGRDARFVEHFAYLSGFLSVTNIHDAASGYGLENMQEHVGFAFARPHHIAEVGADKRLPKDVFFFEKQLLLNIVHHFGGGCSGEGKHGRIGKKLTDGRNPEVGWPKVVSPLRDAMCFIYGNHGDGQEFEARTEALRFQSFGADVEEFHVPKLTVVEQLGRLFGCLSGIETHGLDAAFLQMRHLIFHEGNEGSDNEAYAIGHTRDGIGGLVFAECHRHGRHLKTDALTSACWQECEGVSSATNTMDDFRLKGAEIIVMPILA